MYFTFNIFFNNAKISKNFDVNLNQFKIKSGLSRKECQEKVGFLNKILLDGFNGIADFQMEDVFLI